MPRNGRRVLVLSNHFTEGYGGTPESVLLLAAQLALLGIECDVSCDRGLCRNIGEFERLPRADERNAFEPVAPALADYRAIFVAGSWNLHAPLLVLRARMAGIVIVYAAKGCLSHIEFTRLRDIRRVPYLLLVEWWLLLAARYVVFTSRIECEACILPRLLWSQKAVLIPEPFESTAAIAPAGRDGTTIGFLAEISPRKGLLELIAGFGVLLAKHPSSALRLKIAGMPRAGTRAYMEACKALSVRNGSAAHIDWLGAVRGGAREIFYSGLDLFVCPSRFESFGLTVLEALWQGTPVCAGRCLGVLEFLRKEAPVVVMNSLRDADIARSLIAFFTAQPTADAWRGREAGTQSNRNIALTFARLFFGDAFER